MGSETLVNLVDSVTAAVRHDPAAIDSFLTKLDGLDWSDDMRRSSDLVRFHVRDAQIFEVDDEFPQLPANSILLNGVLAVRYTISLANLPQLDIAEVRQDIADATAA
jgi:hypothetical protein